MSLLNGPGISWIRQNLPRLPWLVNLTWGLFRDPRVSKPHKAILLGALAYVASPIDVVPDFIPVIGQVDDLLLLLAALEMFVRLAPPEVVQEVEERYRRGHGPLWDDLRNVEQHLGRLWSWARKAASRRARRYAGRVEEFSRSH